MIREEAPVVTGIARHPKAFTPMFWTRREICASFQARGRRTLGRTIKFAINTELIQAFEARKKWSALRRDEGGKISQSSSG